MYRLWGGPSPGEDYDVGVADYRNSIIPVGTNKYKNQPKAHARARDPK